MRRSPVRSIGPGMALLANQERRRIERSKVIQWGEVLAARLMGGPEHIKEVIRTAKTSRDSPQSRPWRCELGTRGRLAYDCMQR